MTRYENMEASLWNTFNSSVFSGRVPILRRRNLQRFACKWRKKRQWRNSFSRNDACRRHCIHCYKATERKRRKHCLVNSVRNRSSGRICFSRKLFRSKHMGGMVHSQRCARSYFYCERKKRKRIVNIYISNEKKGVVKAYVCPNFCYGAQTIYAPKRSDVCPASGRAGKCSITWFPWR